MVKGNGGLPRRISVIPLGGLVMVIYTGPTYYSTRRRHIVWQGDYLSINHHLKSEWIQDNPQQWVEVK